MKIAKKLLGLSPLDGVEAFGRLLDDLFTSDDERAAAKLLLEKLRAQPHLLQAEMNKIEAGHRSLFVAGWRPFIGWTCGLGVFWIFLGQPIMQWALLLAGYDIAAPNLPEEHLFELVMALLGLGGLRTYEKLKGRTL